MTTPRPIETTNASLARDLYDAGRYCLGGPRGLLILAAVVLAAGLALNWSWLVAAGVAPILIGVLPCLAMCGLGLCMNRLGGKSCATGSLPVEPAEKRPSGAIAEPFGDPESQAPKERTTNDA